MATPIYGDTGIVGGSAPAGAPGSGGHRRLAVLLVKVSIILAFCWVYTDFVLLEVFWPSAREPGSSLTVLAPMPATEPASPEPEAGRIVFESNGCNACHSIDGSAGIGPTLLGIWGTAQQMDDGSAVIVDEPYVRESILEPQARLVEGYDAAMPSYDGLLTTEDVELLVDYIRSLE